MKNRALINRLVKRLSIWAAKQVLTSLPVIGGVFKALFFGMDLLREVELHLTSNRGAVPQFA
jgi:hypothetical protein